jgi:glycosyltransferase involved in cell wall biosynthesis
MGGQVLKIKRMQVQEERLEDEGSPGNPHIDVVIIGLNSAKTLESCISSVKSCHYPQTQISIFYADGGSRDASCGIAEAWGIKIIKVASATPSPGRQRNSGWRSGNGQLVQFMDSDTLLDPEWLNIGAASFSKGIGAVCGMTRELHPERSVYNWLADQEWNGPSGETNTFGGIVLVSRKALEDTGGYSASLIAGEDPELAYRVRKAGYRVLRLGSPMVKHDINMTRFGQYWKRAFRSGYGYAEVNAMHPDLWHREVLRMGIRGGCFFLGLLLLPSALLSPWLLFLPAIAALLTLRPRLMLSGKIGVEMNLSRSDARLYSWHASIVVIPQFLGMARYWLGKKLARPMTNSRKPLIL